MINAVVYTDGEDCGLCGFKIESHGGDIVCAAVSMLAINTVNSLETLTDCRLAYLYDESGGYIECLLSGPRGQSETLLLRSLELGLRSVADMYGDTGDGVALTRMKAPKTIKHPNHRTVTEYKR